MLIRRVIQTPMSTPNLSLFLETGELTVKSLIMMRRMNFLFYLMNLKESTMLHKFLQAQRRNPSPGDWILQIMNDMKILGIKERLEDLATMKRECYKRMIKRKITEYTYNELMHIKSSSVKLKNLTYKSLKTQDYLKSESMTDELTTDVFKYRTHMLEFHANYRHNETTIRPCPLCKSHPDSQDSIGDCQKMKTEIKDLDKLQNLYEEDFDKDSAKILSKVLKMRKRLNEEMNCATNECIS